MANPVYMEIANNRIDAVSYTHLDVYKRQEYVLSRLKCSWNLSTDNSTVGTVGFRKYIERLDSRMVTTLYQGRSLFEIQLAISDQKVSVGERVTIKATLNPLKTKHSDTTQAIVSLNFMVFDLHSSKLLPKSNRRILYNGGLTRQVSTSKHAEVPLDLVIIERGTYEISVCVTKITHPDDVLQFSTRAVTFCAV